MDRIQITLHREESAFLDEATPEGATPQMLVRALLKLAADDKALLKKTQEAARTDTRIPRHPDDAPGFTKGLTVEDYRRAVAEAGSLAGAARLLDVHRSTVREMCEIHEIEVPSMGGVPG